MTASETPYAMRQGDKADYWLILATMKLNRVINQPDYNATLQGVRYRTWLCDLETQRNPNHVTRRS